MKHLIAIAAVIAAIAGASAFTARGSDSKTLSFVTHQHDFTQVDAGKKGLSVGDSFIFSERLLENGKPAGADHVVCVHSANWPTDAETCTGTVDLSNGTLVLAGQAQRGPFTIAVVGGTGSYTGATGSAKVNSHGSSGTLTITLT